MSDSIFRAFHQSGMPSKNNSNLHRVAGQWNPRIIRALRRMGRAIWPSVYRLGLIRMPRYRLRRRAQPSRWSWWIEHDIPPYDRFRCAAYEVELSLDEKDRPILRIRNGNKTRTLADIDQGATPPQNPHEIWTAAEFERLLADAGQEAPMIIRRDFGPAND
jgi:hypothetical protein